MFGLFKKTPQDAFRKSVRKGFNSCINNVRHKLSGEPLTDALLVQTAITSFYESMKNSPEIQIIGLAASGWMPEAILKEECDRALKKYLE